MPEGEAQSLEYARKAEEPELKLPAWVEYGILLVILLANVLLKAPNLGHPSLKPMDESFHAVVARNLMYDPFKPTLIREPYLPYDPTDWLSNHVWLHKPVLPLWIIALSFKMFGVSALALRLPSLVLSTFAVALTYLIARRVYSPIVGLIAAAIQAIVPTIGMIVHGYVFSDAIDINLLFWCELSLFLMLLNGRRWIWLSGAAAGAAFMSKTFPAMFTFGPLILILIVRRISPSPSYSGERAGVRGERRSLGDNPLDSTAAPHPNPLPLRTGGEGTIAQIVGWLFAFLLIAAPWNIYCAIRFPTEFKAEFGLILTHLSADVENWSSPWDRLWFQHLPSALYLFWTISLIGTVVLTIRAIQYRKWEWLFAPLWSAAVLIPFTLATSKTPSATLPAWPALMIGGGFMIWRACRGHIVEASTTIVLLVAMIFFRGQFIQKGWGQTQPFEIMNQAKWILIHLLAGITVVGVSLAFDKRLNRQLFLLSALAVAIGVVFAGYRTAALALRVQRLSEDWPMRNDLGAIDVAKWIKENLPTDTILDGPPDVGTCNIIMFYSDRTTLRDVPYPREERVYHVGWHMASTPPGTPLYEAMKPGGGWVVSDTSNDRPYRGIDGKPSAYPPHH